MKSSLKKVFSLFLGALLIAQFFVFAPFADSATGVPKIISYQGRLANSSGSLLGDSGTTYNFRFGIYNATSGGTRLWPSGGGDPCTHALTVREGVFNAGVGDTSECSDVLDYNFHDNDSVYLQVEVYNGTSWETLTPRQRIGASGFAINSQTISGTTGGTPNVLGNLVTAYSFQGGASATTGTAFLLDTPNSFVGNFIDVRFASTTRFILDQGGRAAFGTSTFSGLSVLTVGATTTTSIPLTLKGVFGQNANLFQILDSADTQLLTVDNTGQLGVSSSTPRAAFSVNGNILVGGTGGASPVLSGTSTIVSNLVVYGNFRVNGVCISGCTSSGLSGGGTQNFIAKFTGAAAVGDSQIFDNGFVAIATTTSSARFSVYGSTTIQTWENVPLAFNILNAATSSVFSVDTRNGKLTFSYASSTAQTITYASTTFLTTTYASTTALSATAGTITNASSTYLSTLQNLNVGNDLFITGDASSTYFSTSQNLTVGNDLIITGDASSTYFSTSQNLNVGNS
ncbi:MAG: hypothetical protein Q7R73_00065, partial [bacterium]|nr:hypothetical protein [bacterium]